MKKLIFLALMAFALVGFVSAGAAHPPGVFTLDTVLSENSGYEVVVTSDTVLATQGFSALPASFLAFPATINDLSGQPQGYHTIKPLGVVLGEITADKPDYQLRL